MKLGRLKIHLGDPLQGPRSPARPTKRSSESNVRFSFGHFSFQGENMVTATVRSHSDDLSRRCSSGAFDLNDCVLENSGNWSVLSTDGDEPTPRFNHAAAVIGSKMVVVGGESGHRLLDDTMILSLDKLTWVAASPKVYLSPSGLSHKIPSCKGHCLVPWGKMVILIGGKTEPASDRVAVWSFDIETECWSQLEAKGDIPVARSGHTVIRAGPVLILFGGEDAKGKKLNDLHMFDLKSLTWLPLHYKGAGPSPRSNHVAALYHDKSLFIFGGQSKSKILNDLYSLNFETMVWSRVKTRGSHPSARAGCCGALCGTKWYIIGGGSKKRRHAETLVFDVIKLEWSESVTPPSTSIITNKGFSMVPVQHKDKILLVAFGGKVKEASNKVEVLVLVQIDRSMSWRSAPVTDLYEDYGRSKELASVDSLARSSLASAVDQQASGRKSLSDSLVDRLDPHPISDSVSLRKQFHQEEDCSLARKLQKPVEIEKHRDGDDCSAREQKSKKRLETAVQMDIAGILAAKEETLVDSECTIGKQKLKHITLTPDADHGVPPEADGRAALLTSPSNIYQLYETNKTNIASLTRKNSLLEEQLTAALSSKETAEKSLSSAVRSREDAERRLADALKEAEVLKEKLASLELAQEEANSLSNAVHADNVRLEHDVAFLKAILDDTQKELHSTRGVLAGERARAFQLQVEVFHLKQRLQSAENRAPTPRKPYH
ncbi:acyl-CoA-binding domain-containing protein 4 isoform X3 [Ananas comosus]|nr:acyl-CoA-binding domain-containing protein 4 isoform X3 [Ananas comosus]